MAELIRPVGKLVIGLPTWHGYVTEMAFARMWNFGENADGSRPYEWVLNNAEIIPQIGALCPAGDTSPVDMASWSTGPSNLARQTYVSARTTVKWHEHTDGSVHTTAEPLSNYVSTSGTDDIGTPHLAIHIKRYLPPPNQGIHTCTIVQMRATMDGDDGWIGIAFPIAGNHGGYDVRNVMVYWWDSRLTGLVDVFSSSVTHLLTGPSASARTEEYSSESWGIEWIEQIDEVDTPGTWLVLRRLDANDDPYVALIDGLRLPGYAGDPQIVHVSCQGAVQYVNVSPIRYSTARAWPTRSLAIPSHGSPPATGVWNDTTSYLGMMLLADQPYISIVDGTAMSVGHHAPHIQLNAGGHIRPTLWGVGEMHYATVGGSDTTTADTDGDETVVSMDWTIDSDWRGSRGTVEFTGSYIVQYAGQLKRQSRVALTAGWEGTTLGNYAPTLIGTGYVTDIRRVRTGEDPYLAYATIDVSDLVVARLMDSAIVDGVQAGGRTVTEWFSDLMWRCGIPTSMIVIHPSVASLRIPLQSGRYPSEPAFPQEDGASIVNHIDEVLASFSSTLGIRPRFGVDRLGRACIDLGRPQYVHGTSTIYMVVDDRAADAVFERIEPSVDTSGYRNSVLVVSGSTRRYMIGSTATISSDGWQQWGVVSRDDAVSPAGLAMAVHDEYAGRVEMVSISFPLVPSIDPDMFVRIDHADGTSITEGSVWQVIRHRMTMSAERNEAESSIDCVWVYSP